jgi:imidazolonepropionase-like amidohydrolase
MARSCLLAVNVVGLLACTGLALAARKQSVSAPAPIAITHVTVIDVKTGERRPDQTILILRDRITHVGPSATARLPSGTREVDGSGAYAIPGLWDMHVHIFNQVSLRPANTWDFPLFVANGVLGVREMWTKPGNMAEVRRWRNRVRAGALIAPRVAAVGRVLDGANPVWRNTDSVTTPEDARRLVDETQAAGIDFVKVYSKLPREAYFAIVLEANRKRITFAGHVPFAVDANEASDAGQRSFEHLSGIFESCSTRSAELRQVPWDDWTTAQDSLMLATYEAARCAILFRRLAANGTVQVPTLALWQRDRMSIAELANDPRLRYIPAGERATWEPYRARFDPSTAPLRRRYWEARLRVVGAMRREGVHFMTGTDLGNPYIYPGFSVHDELSLLVEAGLSPLEALQATTLNPAQFLSVADSLGTLEAGKLADIVLLEADPLTDIRNTTKIRAVVLNGRLLLRSDLDSLLEAAAGGLSAQVKPVGRRR